MSAKLRILYTTFMQFFPIILVLTSLNLVWSASWTWWLTSFIIIFFMSVYGFSIGFHHTFAHRTFRFNSIIETFLMYLGTCATLVSPLTWSVSHAAHHRYVDTEYDPHSPNHLRWKILFYYNHIPSKTSLVPVRHLLKDRRHQWLDSNLGYWLTVLSFPALSYSIGGLTGLIFIWALPTFCVLWTGIVFALAHSDIHDENNKASNSKFLWILSLGDGNHKKHHSDYRYVGKFHRLCAYALGGKSNVNY